MLDWWHPKTNPQRAKNQSAKPSSYYVHEPRRPNFGQRRALLLFTFLSQRSLSFTAFTPHIHRQPKMATRLPDGVSTRRHVNPCTLAACAVPFQEARASPPVAFPHRRAHSPHSLTCARHAVHPQAGVDDLNNLSPDAGAALPAACNRGEPSISSHRRARSLTRAPSPSPSLPSLLP